MSIVCKGGGKPHGKAPHLSQNDINRVIKLREVAPTHGNAHSCKIISGVPGVRIVLPRSDDAPPALKEFHK